MDYELMVLGLISFAAPWLARWAGYETTRKPFDLVGVGGIFFLLTSAFDLSGSLLALVPSLMHVAMAIALVMGMILLAIGGVWGIVEALHEPVHPLAPEHG